MANPAIFLDRDGTLIEDVGYPSHPEHIRILAGVARALLRLAGAGYKLVVVTNQSGIARGILTEDDLNRFHQALDEQLELLGARLDAYYSCPHHPDPAAAMREDLAVECDCRKPKPGLILQAAQDLEIDLAASWTVGDKWRDIASGQAAGTRTIKLPSAPSSDDLRPPDVGPPTAEASGLDEAATFILDHPAPEPAPEVEPSVAESPTAGVPRLPDEGGMPTPPLRGHASGEGEDMPSERHAGHATPDIGASPETFGTPLAAPAPEVSESPAKPEEAEEAVEEEEVMVEEEAPPLPVPPAPPPEPLPPVLSQPPERRDEPALAQSPAAAPPADLPATLLREILGELRRLDRARHPPSLSLQRLMAYILQAGAAACFVFGLVSPERTTFLLITCILLLVALTLIVFERRP